MTVNMFPEPPEPDPEREEGGRERGEPADAVPGGPRSEALHEWQERGYRISDARVWIRENFRLADAERWRAAGVYRPQDAREWRTAGITAYTVDRLLRAGMTPRDAVRWREFGVPADQAADRHLAGEEPGRQGLLARLRRRMARPGSPSISTAESSTMRALLAAGIPVEKARSYLDGGWEGAEAVDWARRGIKPSDAKVFQALGFSSAEAARLLGAGQDSIAVMTEWWRAEVPFDEVSAWSAAGFTPADAAAQRAAGADLEQAKILRALTDD